MALWVLFCSSVTASAQSFSIDWYSIDAAGGTSTGGAFVLSGAIGQPDPSQTVVTTPPSTGGGFSLVGSSPPPDLVWTNLLGGDWNVAANWSPNFVPTRNDNAIINIGVTVTVSSPAECFGLILGGFSVSPTLTGGGTIAIYGLSTWLSGTMSGSGRTVVEPGGSLSVANPGGNAAFLNSRTLENGGTILWTGVGGIVMNFGANLTNRAGALFDVQNAASLQANVGGGQFDNAGTFRKSAITGTTTIGSGGLSFNNFGTVEIQSGTLQYNAGFINHGTVILSAETTNRLAAGGSGGGTFNAAGAALVEWTGGTFTLNAGAQLNGGGVYRINVGTLTCNPDLTVNTLDLAFGTLNGPGKVTIASAMNWTGGTMSGTGRTIIPPGATLNAALPGGGILSTRTLENSGSMLLSTGFLGVIDSAVVTNRAGAMFRVESETGGVLGGGGANGRFDNAGTFRKSAGTGTTTVASGLTFNNSGSVEIQTGTLNLAGGGTHSGSFDVPGGAALTLAGTHNAAASSSLSGAGHLTFSGGIANLAGLVNVRGSNTFSGGTANFTGHTICTNNTVTISGGTANFSGTGLVSPSVMNLSFGDLSGTGTVTVNNVLIWAGGAMSGSGRTIIPVGATLNATIPSVAIITSRTLENGGTVLWTGAGNIGLFGSAVITNRAGALFHAQNAASLGFFSGFDRFDNAGTFRKSANNGTLTIGGSGSFNNSGTLEIEAGTVLCAGAFNNSGAVSLSAGTTNRLAGGGSATGTFANFTTGLVEWTGGTFTLNPGAQLNGTGLYRLNGGNVTANANLTVENLDLVHGSSTLDGTGATTIANAMNWTAGTMSGSGRTTISAGATLQVGSASGVNLQRALENGGTAIWTGAGTFILLNGVITNRSGALFLAQNAATLFPIGACRFDNAGTFRKSINIGTTTFNSGLALNNSGTVDIRSGILAANGGYLSSPLALLNCALGGTTAGTGFGQLQVAGTVTLNGGLSVDLLPGFSPAINDSFTVLTAGTRSATFANFFYPSNAVTMQLSNTANSVIARVTDVLTAIPRPVLLPPELIGLNVNLTWTAVSNTTYRLEFNPNPTPSNWSVLLGDVTATSNTASKFDPLTPSNRLYRVRVLPP